MPKLWSRKNRGLFAADGTQLTEETRKAYQVWIERFSDAGYSCETADIGDVQSFLANLHRSANTKRHALNALSNAFEEAKHKGLRKDNPVSGLPRERKAQIIKLILPPLDEDQVVAMIHSADTPRDKAIVRLLSETGLRVSELCNLRIGDFERTESDESRIHVRGKGKKDRYVPLSESCSKAVQKYLGYRQTAREHLFLNQHGKRMTPQAVGAVTAAAGKRAGIAGRVSPFRLRRTFAIALRNRGEDLVRIGEALGHASVTSTQQLLSPEKRGFSVCDGAQPAEMTRKTYQRFIELFNDAGYSFETAGTGDVQAFLAELGRAGYAPASVGVARAALNTMFLEAIHQGVRKDNPIVGLPREESPRRVPEVFTQDQVVAMIHSADTPRDKAIVRLFSETGLRVSELCNLTIGDFERTEGNESRIHVRGKGKKDRYVPLSESCSKAVQECLGHRQGAREHLFLQRSDTPMTRFAIFGVIQKIGKRAGIAEPVNPTKFRNTFAKALLDRGADVQAVKRVLGHESTVATAIYTAIGTGTSKPPTK
ncbi:MAG: tyrosine-type recombinase/integrase [Planctomycetes bacterium]|nr:tyrosine-type recombinase/integrase [Planctomycetota bacterium]